MMSMPAAADDVSPLALRNDVARLARNDAMFALICRSTHHQRSDIMCEAHIICPTGQTSFKNALLSVDKRGVFDGQGRIFGYKCTP
jgi:hypothetical protein